MKCWARTMCGPRGRRGYDLARVRAERAEVRTARAKGLRERAVVLRHAYRNALIPVITVLGIQIGRLLGGAVIIEAVFAWPGMGRLAVQAIISRDYVVVQGALLLLVTTFIVVNLVVDISYGFIDPRVRVG